MSTGGSRKKLCLSLFEHNGVELQTAAWYTLVRTHLAGLYGMNEGLAITGRAGLPAVGQYVAAADDCANQNTQFAQSTAAAGDAHAVADLYRPEPALPGRSASERRWMTYCSVWNSNMPASLTPCPILLPQPRRCGWRAAKIKRRPRRKRPRLILPPSSLPEPTAQVKWVYVAEPASRPNADVVTAFPAPAKPWKPFVAGMLTMLALAGAAAGRMAGNAPVRFGADAVSRPVLSIAYGAFR
ncbi:type VI secretion system protein VasL [Klebsiella michiganensis]|uniref:Type VI secretion system protein VasL n=1 Tax=Klebsiella michiganensis TaxID=1134687 RepID=A0A7H4N0C2_9ENTR|nr:type VI secretion system protein VasL [Klebsiella michiganensis]